jgi:hypothetical protein
LLGIIVLPLVGIVIFLAFIMAIIGFTFKIVFSLPFLILVIILGFLYFSKR